MTDLDKLNDKEQDKQDTANVNQDTLNKVSGGFIPLPANLQDALNKVSGGISESDFGECPNCHGHLYFIPMAICIDCEYKG